MYLLQADDEHRAVSLLQNRRFHVHDIVRSNREEEAVERGVVQSAQRDAVAHNRLSFEIAVRRNVSCIEKLRMAELTQGAAISIRANDAFAKQGLVEPASERPSDISPSRLKTFGNVAGCRGCGCQCGSNIVHLHREGQCQRLVADDKHRVRRSVKARLDGMEVDKRHSLMHGTPQPNIVAVAWVGPAVRVPEQAARNIEPI